MDAHRIAVIVDLVDSKAIDDRRAAQAAIVASFARVDPLVPHDQPLRATVGDEFQAVYPTLADALEATLLARLALPNAIDCRFGLGRGDVIDVGDGAAGVIQDGSAWWLAREAIDEAHSREDGRTPSVRSWFRSSTDDAARESLVNAYLMARDQIVGAMTERVRRLTFGTMLGSSQGELADLEGITQSAVSQALRRSGGASLITAVDELRKGGV
ncbi:SatD family protein [Salinibacterium sp. G-O1]|uniref:SatD family protein n=1 Tax=Salinibacterium sp. G-O1 TaxID=3046208 RepID=UPI0024B96B41|nr:SatD family protein [Salinibacterium sp. G-O1]MDJ0335291.1 SatD family protein [Salinibacterium sp. G-O1]